MRSSPCNHCSWSIVKGCGLIWYSILLQHAIYGVKGDCKCCLMWSALVPTCSTQPSVPTCSTYLMFQLAIPTCCIKPAALSTVICFLVLCIICYTGSHCSPHLVSTYREISTPSYVICGTVVNPWFFGLRVTVSTFRDTEHFWLQDQVRDSD